MKTKLTYLILLFHLTTIIAQNNDGLLQILKDNVTNSTTDSASVHHKIILIKKMYTFNVDTSRILLKEVFKTIDKYPEREYYFQKHKAVALNYLAILDKKEDKMEAALSNYLNALDLSKKIYDSITMGLSFHNLGMFYRKQKEFKKSKDYFRKAISIKKKIGDVEELALSYHMFSVTHYQDENIDSALFYVKKTKALPCSNLRKAKVNTNLAAIYYSQKKYDKSKAIYKENIKMLKATNDQSWLSTSYLNLAVLHNALKEYDKAVPYLDTAIVLARKMKRKDLLLKQYFSRSSVQETRKKYKKALVDYKIAMAYFDTINDTKKVKRITELELNHKFEKEKLANRLQLDNESSKKKLYLLISICIVLLSSIILWLYRKNTKQQIRLSETRLQQQELEKLKTELALVTREKELKNAVVENSIKQEVFKQTLKEIKAILKLDNEQDRKKSLQSITASLLSETVTSNSDLKSYLDKVSFDFKVILDNKLPQLNEREKEILCLMTLGLNATEISKLQNSSVSAIKSSRSRIRKKIGVNSKEDIITYIKNL
ncbi:tetratricopeptide repeat protein [Tenacibaculum jejuense]|uniref:HTH luxR-type domain-containing protein n=1 Tax=Tenacibaculum jejuense TaxID=584609 RepID=A0A238UA71_9FLAO|nr:tetratricopeptide repeat protein [Tenacibaculum jejuense]SNR15300.1 Probable transmembrane protein of unknown function. Tetratricopeptide repeats containing protein [Tenacibaculum jejuense]